MPNRVTAQLQQGLSKPHARAQIVSRLTVTASSLYAAAADAREYGLADEQVLEVMDDAIEQVDYLVSCIDRHGVGP